MFPEYIFGTKTQVVKEVSKVITKIKKGRTLNDIDKDYQLVELNQETTIVLNEGLLNKEACVQLWVLTDMLAPVPLLKTSIFDDKMHKVTMLLDSDWAFLIAHEPLLQVGITLAEKKAFAKVIVKKYIDKWKFILSMGNVFASYIPERGSFWFKSYAFSGMVDHLGYGKLFDRVPKIDIPDIEAYLQSLGVDTTMFHEAE